MTFDTSTAECVQRRVGGRHDAFRDSRGNICLECLSRNQGGGVAINQEAVDWLLEQDCPGRFLRLINYAVEWNCLVDLEDLLPLNWITGDGSDYAIVRPIDVVERKMSEVPF